MVDFIESIKKELKEESHEYGIVSDDDTRIVIGEGGSIQHLLMPDHFQTVLITGLTSDYSVAAATNELKAYGECTDDVKFTQNNSILLFIKYEDPANAVLALNHQFDSFSDPTVVIRQHRERNRNKFCLKVEWCRRRRRGYGYINFEEDDFISYVCPSFGPFHTKEDALSGIEFYIKQETQSIKFDGIGPHTTEEFVWSQLLANVPYLDEVIDIDKVDIFFIYESPFEETDESYTEQKQCIDENLAKSVARNEYYIDFLCPTAKKVKYTARVYFNDSDTCLKALKGLKDGKGKKYTIELSLSSKVRYSSQIFSVIKESIQELSDHYSKAEEPATIKCEKDRWGNTFVNISANDIDVFTEAKESLSEAEKPEIISLTGNEECTYVSTAYFRKIAKEIQTRNTTLVKINDSSLNVTSITIYGTRKRREITKEEIEMHLRTVMQDGTQCFEINLKEHSPGLMKHLVTKYGTEVTGVADLFEGITATRLDPRRQTLTLFATKDAHRSFVESLKEFKPKDITKQVPPVNTVKTDSIECCVCFEAHNSMIRETFFYRLEYCGHVYCRECIQQQLEPTTVTFPITCAAENCGQLFVWKDFDNLIHNEVLQLRDITSASLKAYVAMNTATVRNCITPDCEMVYLYSESGQRFVCGQCGANICTHCHTTWHEGYDTCSAYKNRDNRDTQLNAWMTKDKTNRKKCPKCDVPIEKNGGCLHVACTQCRSHICWVCLRQFNTPGECYDHLSEKHEGIFGNDNNY